MTVAAPIEEPVPPVLPPLGVAAEVAAAPPEAAPAEQVAERVLPEIEHPIGPLRQAVLDALADADEPLSVARIIAELPVGVTRNSAESAIKREHDAGRIMRTSPGHYTLAPPQPAKPPEPAPPSPEEEAIWFAALEAWVNDPETWNREVLGPRPDEPDRRIPTAIVARGIDRSRKRQQRAKDAEEAARRRAARQTQGACSHGKDTSEHLATDKPGSFSAMARA